MGPKYFSASLNPNPTPSLWGLNISAPLNPKQPPFLWGRNISASLNPSGLSSVSLIREKAEAASLSTGRCSKESGVLTPKCWNKIKSFRCGKSKSNSKNPGSLVTYKNFKAEVVSY